MIRFLFSLLSNFNGLIHQRPTVKSLRKWGAIIGNDVELINVNCGRKDASCLQIGSHVTLTHITILTHDASPQRFVGHGINRVGRIVYLGRK